MDSSSGQTASTTKKSDKGKNKEKQKNPLAKTDKAPKVERLLKNAIKSLPRAASLQGISKDTLQKDVKIISLSSSRDLFRDLNPISDQTPFQVITPTLENIADAPQVELPTGVETSTLDTTVNAEASNLGVPIGVEIPHSNILVDIETPRQSSQGDAPSFELRPDILLGTWETIVTPDSAQLATSSSKLDRNDLESSMPPPASIPSADFDLISFFNDDAEVDNIFDVLENWTSGALMSKKMPESVVAFQPLLEAFRSKA
ncbi:uncharacterized protein LOC109817923 isoform X1 [Cajanus cajan]|uniref:uncharacterized protein LOC109817923 isoform X1 n=1 Tax=Cajanus cajan TaxID=3821 RepID=UPI0010FB3EF7|nr:uncharacterized protein LOC109817923 isoform X1 [Cajanus cajan]